MLRRFERFGLRALQRLPDRALSRLGGGAPVVVEGRRLDPLIQVMLRLSRVPPIERMPAPKARRVYAQLVGVTQADELPMASARELCIPVEAGRIRARCLVPRGLPTPSPAIVWLHGGGHVIGDIDDTDRSVRYVAERARCRLVNVEYRCAPEHPFPTAAEDAIAAYCWVREHSGELGIDPERIAVMGDSAGGNLSAVVALAARDRGFPPPRLQGLLYPAVDLRLRDRSVETFATGYGFTRALADWFTASYVPKSSDRENPLASPLLAQSHAGLAPAIVSVAGFDLLHDQGVAYADALRAAGTRVTLLRHDSLIHAWATMTGPVPVARAAMDETCALVAGELAG